MKHSLLFLMGLFALNAFSQQPQPAKHTGNYTSQVNVFLGSSGDHGQLSPAASYPFSMLSIGPQTYPHTHTGYEHNAKQFLGFTHNRFEGVGCMGSGGNLFIKPFLGKYQEDERLMKVKESASPGYYSVGFSNGIHAEMTVMANQGMHRYTMPKGEKGFYIDLGYAFNGGFLAEEHKIDGNKITGFINSKTTCGAGAYRVYYEVLFTKPVRFESLTERKLLVLAGAEDEEIGIRVSFSSTGVAYAQRAQSTADFYALKKQSDAGWEKHLGRIEVKGDAEREKLFYSLLYRTIQSPYQISEADGAYKAIDGSTQKATNMMYNGWAIWDNYRTQLPLLSLAYPERFQDVAVSIANLYKYGKKDYATKNEPSPTVRTEHAVVVILDALRKGHKINTKQITDSLIKEVDGLDYGQPDKALEASYDAWALSEILRLQGNKELSAKYLAKAMEYKNYWNKDFKDITRSDVDRMQARKLYQGTIWQYRWFVPFDVKGLIDLIGGEQTYIEQLDYFFKNDLYNHANEPDLQVPLMYNATPQAWKSQKLMRNYAVDTVVQYYFNDNSRGIDPFVDRIYQNKPQAYVRTMDDDAGAMSAWFVLTATGISPACVGHPVYYLNVPLFRSVKFSWPKGKSLDIEVENFSERNMYIREVRLNGKVLGRNWLSHDEIIAGGKLVIVATDEPQENKNIWVTDVNAR
ncbi:glycoside hydrolase domain-containing protein [Pedobacter faecalis]|uniref:glycoside hydrolase domain-containing protein n=1 Tax=Pedobacter faecalis TaxID=3041495 RepID=UPI00254EEDC0|nr:glycoside hydrolase domain-containing protein [Pedobacter sp. ELA7]